jgi:ketosteroid isomerase-like protein
MKRNVSVFILLILVASSFKYRTKTIGASLTPGLEIAEVKHVEPKYSVAAFETAISRTQEANQQLAQGNSEPIKQLWSHEDDVAIYCESVGVEVKGWKSVDERLSWLSGQMTKGTYSYDLISSHVGDDFGSIQQTEHYKSADGKSKDLAVTILFRKEGDGWKIFNRRAEHLSGGIAMK